MADDRKCSKVFDKEEHAPHPWGGMDGMPWSCPGWKDDRTWPHNPDNMLRSWRSLVAATQWWPGSRLEVEEVGFSITLQVSLVTKDSYQPDRTVLIKHRRR